MAYIAQIVRSIFFYYCSLDFEECAHKLLKMDFPESQTVSLASYSFLLLLRSITMVVSRILTLVLGSSLYNQQLNESDSLQLFLKMSLTNFRANRLMHIL